jgi:hypothetical protein
MDLRFDLIITRRSYIYIFSAFIVIIIINVLDFISQYNVNMYRMRMPRNIGFGLACV